MNIRYPIYEGVYRILTIFFGSYNIIELCNHIIHSQCSQQMYMFFQIGFFYLY